jgi:3-keto-disaccharide hydrolase
MKTIVAVTGLSMSLMFFPPLLQAQNQGEVLFEDDFAVLDPAWSNVTAISVENQKLVLKPSLGSRSTSLYQASFFDDMDASLDIQMAEGSNENWYAGLVFWATDSDNSYEACIAPEAGSFAVRRWLKGRELYAVVWRSSDAIKKEPGASNVVRVVTTGPAATMFINGNQVATFKGQPPEGGGFVGVCGSSGKSAYVWDFSQLSIHKPSVDAPRSPPPAPAPAQR